MGDLFQMSLSCAAMNTIDNMNNDRDSENTGNIESIYVRSSLGNTRSDSGSASSSVHHRVYACDEKQTRFMVITKKNIFQRKKTIHKKMPPFNCVCGSFNWTHNQVRYSRRRIVINISAHEISVVFFIEKNSQNWWGSSAASWLLLCLNRKS